MRGFVQITALSLAASLIAGEAAIAASGALEPYEMVRSLEALQDQIVLGNQTALAAQPKLIGVIAEALAAAPTQSWSDPKNIRALSVYLLSGGRPQVVEKLLASNVIPASDQNLVKGALAFDEGRQSDAKQLLSDIDARSLTKGVGGYVAFAQSKLFTDDRQKAMGFLDLARLLAPGTLIEEAALRREVFLADDMGDIEKFVFLSGDYIRRFQKSLYAANFRQRFASAVIHLGLSEAPDMTARLDDLFKELNTDDQRNISLMIARAGVIAGKMAAVRFAVDRADHLTADGSVEKDRTKLYDAAALILSPDYSKGVELLQEVQRARLPGPDAELDDAISAVAQRIGQWSAVTPDTDEAKTGLSQDDQKPSDMPTIDLARKALADADQVLKDSKL